MTELTSLDEPSRALHESIERARSGRILVVTGAGVSAASGIPTFRGSEPNAVWRQHDVRMATVEYFRQDPISQLSWYLDRFDAARAARPNRAHHALVDLERWFDRAPGTFHLVTQNIDTLHEEAGSRRLIKVHGTLDRVRCSRDGCDHGSPHGSLPLPEVEIESFRAAPDVSTLPRCPVCDAVLRAHVLLFDEHYQDHMDYRFSEVVSIADGADLILFVGTSFSVGVTELILRTGLEHGSRLFSIDPAGVNLHGIPVVSIERRAEEVLPALVRDLSHSRK